MTGVPYDEIGMILPLAIVSVLLVAALALSRARGIGLEKEMVKAMLKGSFQLFALSLFLTYLFSSPWWHILTWLLIISMALLAGAISAGRAGGLPKAYRITTPSILLGSTTVLVVLYLSGAMPPEPYFIIPLGGMIFGNSMNICSLTLERLAREIKLNSEQVETMLILGASPREASAPFVRGSVRSALIPTVDNLRTLGIIFIPGAMAGLMMAGTPPLVAAAYQLIVFLMIVGGGMITALTASHLASKEMFTGDHRLADWI